MKASRLSSKNTPPLTRMPERRRRSDRRLAQALAAAAKAKDEHIRDLRILVSNLEEAQKRQEEMTRMMLEHHFYRPTITSPGSAGAPPAVRPGLPADVLSDVATFDEKDDGQLSAEQQKQAREAVKEFDAIVTEHEEWRKNGGRGHRVSAEEMSEGSDAA